MDGIDEKRLGQLLAVMGHDALLALAQTLADGLAALNSVPAAERADHLHRLHGGAISLGFASLAVALADAEAKGDDITPLVAAALTVTPRMSAALHALSCQR